MHTQLKKPPVRQQQAHEPQRPTNSQQKHVDQRPEAQRMIQLKQLAATRARPEDQKIAQLKALADTHTPVQRFPIQRQPTDLKAQMGAQHGVDLSRVKEIPNSSFPGSVGALATIQGNQIDYAPSQFTTANRKHELGHAIDNAKNGTPKGDTIVNGQHVDTTRERAAQKIADTPLQRIQEGGVQPSEKPKVQVLQTLADVSQPKTPIQTLTEEERRQKKRKDKKELNRRIGMLSAPNVETSANEYVEAVHTDPTNRIAVDNVINALLEIDGFRLPYHWYVKNHEKTGFSSMKANADFHTRGRLWSKMNSTISKKLAGDDAADPDDELADYKKGILLESSVAGYIFDGLDFGYPYPGNDLTKYLWDKLSETYVAGLEGTITVDMFEGWDDASVFTNTELPRLLKMMIDEGRSDIQIDINRFGFTEEGIFKLLEKVEKIKGVEDMKARVTPLEIRKAQTAGTGRHTEGIGKKDVAAQQGDLDRTQRLFGELFNNLRGQKKRHQV